MYNMTIKHSLKEKLFSFKESENNGYTKVQVDMQNRYTRDEVQH